MVGIGSVVGICGLLGVGVYSVFKLVVISYCELLWVELCFFGIKVVIIVLGYIDILMMCVNIYFMFFLMLVECFVECVVESIVEGVSYCVILW